MFSIIVPLYNKAATIGSTIESVLRQTYADFELLIVDDGSTDDSVAVVKTFADPRIKLLQQANKGVSAARCFGGGKSLNEWFLFLDADDRLLPNCLETLAHLAERYPEADVCCGNYLRLTSNNVAEACHYGREGMVNNPFYHYFFFHFSIRAGAMMLRREVFLKHPFDSQFHRWEDLKWGLEILRESKVSVTPCPLMEYNLETTQMSKPLKDKTSDFAFNAYFRNRSFWEKMCLGRMIFFSHFASKKDARMLRHIYGLRYYYAPLANVLMKIHKIKHLICHH